MRYISKDSLVLRFYYRSWRWTEVAHNICRIYYLSLCCRLSHPSGLRKIWCGTCRKRPAFCFRNFNISITASISAGYNQAIKGVMSTEGLHITPQICFHEDFGRREKSSKRWYFQRIFKAQKTFTRRKTVLSVIMQQIMKAKRKLKNRESGYSGTEHEFEQKG